VKKTGRIEAERLAERDKVAAERERLEIQKERSNLPGGGTFDSFSSLSDIKASLPFMNGEDVTSFFPTFERALQLANINPLH